MCVYTYVYIYIYIYMYVCTKYIQTDTNNKHNSNTAERFLAPSHVSEIELRCCRKHNNI